MQTSCGSALRLICASINEHCYEYIDILYYTAVINKNKTKPLFILELIRFRNTCNSHKANFNQTCTALYLLCTYGGMGVWLPRW